MTFWLFFPLVARTVTVTWKLWYDHIWSSISLERRGENRIIKYAKRRRSERFKKHINDFPCPGYNLSLFPGRFPSLGSMR